MDIKSIRAQQFNKDLEKLKNKKVDGKKFRKELDTTKNEKSEKILRNEKVDISLKSKEVQDAKKIVDRASDIRWEKVEEIKAQIASGNYKVDAEAIADKWIRTGFYKNLI